MTNTQPTKIPFLKLFKAAYTLTNEKHELVTFRELIPYLLSNLDKFDDAPLTSDKFINAILTTEFTSTTMNNSLKSTDEEDSTLIPENKDIFAFPHIYRLKNKLYDHNCIEILYVYQGTVEFIFGKEHAILPEGSVCFISPKSMHNIVTNDNSFALSILIRNKTLADVLPTTSTYNLIAEFINHILLSNKPVTNYLLFQIQENDSLQNAIKQLVQESCFPSDDYSDELMLSWLRIFLLNLLRAQGKTLIHESLRKTSNLTPIINYIGENYATITLSNLAKKFHYNEAYLSTLISKAFGKNFSTILNNIRLSHATNYLLSTDLTVQSIGEKIGYQSVDYFIRSFKKQYQITPGAYRNLHRR